MHTREVNGRPLPPLVVPGKADGSQLDLAVPVTGHVEGALEWLLAKEEQVGSKARVFNQSLSVLEHCV